MKTLLLLLAVGCNNSLPGNQAPPAPADLAPSGANLVLTPWPTPRAGAAAARGADGSIYLIGGWNDRITSSSVDAYHPDSDTWTEMPALQNARYYAGAVTLDDGRIIVFGGGTGGAIGDRVLLSSVEVLQPGADHWTSLHDLLQPRSAHAFALGKDGKIYAIGGQAPDGQASAAASVGIVSSSTEIYDPASDQWTPGASLLTPRWEASAAVGGDGKIYVMGGISLRAWERSTEVYDPAVGEWKPADIMDVNRSVNASTVGSDGRIYLITGETYNPGDSDSMPLTSVEAFSAADQSWTHLADIPLQRSNATAAATDDGYIFVFGGTDWALTLLGQVQRYSIKDDAWLQAM